jgi:hypothetical protein
MSTADEMDTGCNRALLKAGVVLDALRCASLLADLFQHPHDVMSLEALADFDGQAFPRVHIHHRQCPEAATINELIGNEIKTSHLIRCFCPHLLAVVLGHRPPRLEPCS